MQTPSKQIYSKSTTCDILLMVSVADNKSLSSFMKLLWLPKSVKSGEIHHKFEVTAVQGHPTSSFFVPMESAYATS